MRDISETERELMETTIMYVLDLLGTVIFAVTGAVRGVRLRLDLLGVVVFACTVGIGGGIIRDVILDAPVAALHDETYLILCIVTGLAVFFSSRFFMNKRKVVAWCDAFGLGVFTALGAAKGMQFGLGTLGIMLCGVLTSVGGGVIRDVFSRRIPVILTSDFYATASLLGGLLYAMLYRTQLSFFSTVLVVIVFVTGIRLVAMHYKMRLPVVGHHHKP